MGWKGSNEHTSSAEARCEWNSEPRKSNSGWWGAFTVALCCILELSCSTSKERGMHNKRKGGESGSCIWTRIGSEAQSAKLAARRRSGSKLSLSSAIRFLLDVDLSQVHCPRACGCRRCLGLSGKGERTNGQARQRILKVKRRDLCVLYVVPRCCQRSGGAAMVKNTDHLHRWPHASRKSPCAGLGRCPGHKLICALGNPRKFRPESGQIMDFDGV